ncbi:MAG: radical SAM protein [Rhodospirillales bacterium]|nr:radical SAM protein [Rhodospirillales bacterium]
MVAAINTAGVVRLKVDTLVNAAAAAERVGDRQTAFTLYREALFFDPDHVEAIAGMGRLRFKPPAQPMLDEMRQRATRRACEVTIEVRNPCNYRCFYCVAEGHNNIPVQRMDLAKIEAIYQTVTEEVVVTALECGGGEPTVHPQFPELVRLASKYGVVSFPSNNSQDPKRWLPEETATRLMVRSSLHPEAEAKIERYVANARYLLDRGVKFTSLFIAHPTRVASIPRYRTLFAEAGIPFSPIPFIGEHEGKSYPHAHTDAEREIIGLEDGVRHWTHQIQPATNRIRNFRGIPCVAGHRSLYIAKDGTLRRCLYDGRPLQQRAAQSEPCRVKHCGCGLLLDKLNMVEDIEFYNTWAGMAGIEQMPADWMQDAAARKGHASIQDALAEEHAAMYEALMEAYGKNQGQA